MDFFISQALAQSGESAGGGFLSLLPLVLIFVLFYFLLIRPQQKKAKAHKRMVEELTVGDEVVTNGGLLGTISRLDNYAVTMTVAKGVDVRVQRSMIAQLVPEGTVEEEEKKPQPKKKKKLPKSDDAEE